MSYDKCHIRQARTEVDWARQHLAAASGFLSMAKQPENEKVWDAAHRLRCAASELITALDAAALKAEEGAEG